MNTHTFSTYLEKIDNTASRNEITEILADLFAQADVDEIDKICYLSLGRLVPKFEQLEFQISSKSMIKIIARAYDVDQDEVAQMFKQQGDIGSVAAELAAKTGHTATTSLSIQALYEQLLVIAQEEGSGSVKRKIAGFSDLLKQLDPLSAKYITRIPIGALRLGFSDMTILDGLSWMHAGDKSLRKQLEHAYNVSADIGLIARAFKKGGAAAISHLKATAGIPIRPQQAERMGTAEEMIAKVERAAVEWKLDGFRAQVHVVGNKMRRSDDPKIHIKKQMKLGEDESGKTVKIFSRSLESTTDMFPEIVTAFEKLAVDSVILDGEAIGYDPKTGNHLPFQETIQRKRKHGIDDIAKRIPLRYYAFDLLELNGESYLEKPFSERRKVLEKLLADNRSVLDAHTVQSAYQFTTSDPADLEEKFIESTKNGFEGIMVKKANSSYQAGARNYNWIKFKHHGEGKLSDTLDCVVMGYYAGQGKRSGFGIGAFLVGVQQDPKIQRSKDPNEKQFLTVCKIGTGLSDEQWRELKAKSEKVQAAQMPDEYDVPKDLFPDFWTNPEIVVEIAADEITKSPLHTAGLALRFPRLVRFRDDKNPDQATTVQEVEKLFRMQGAQT